MNPVLALIRCLKKKIKKYQSQKTNDMVSGIILYLEAFKCSTTFRIYSYPFLLLSKDDLHGPLK